VIEGALDSAIAGQLVPYRLYLPPCFYSSGRRYPYVILLHGSGFTYTQWTDDIGVQTAMDEGLSNPLNALAPMALIMPEGGVLQEENFFDTGQSFEDLILDELIPTVESQFCLWNDAMGRAIGGISRGGFWAFSIAFRHPGFFAAVGGHSPFFVEDNAPPSHNPLDLAYNITQTTPLRIFLDNARDDSGGPNVIALSNILRANNVLHTYEISPTGGHDNGYWTAHVRDYLRFYGADWPKDVAGLPTCF
jgi:enterochelin esterase-like enzyme